MRRRSGPSRRLEGLALGLLLSACAPRDAQVGVAAPLDAGGGAGDGAGSSVTYSSQFATNGGAWETFAPLPGASVTFGAESATAGDGLVVELRFPGDPALGPADRSDADLNTGISTRQYFKYGTFRARVQFATCGAGEEIASAVFMYDEGGDANGNGTQDFHELDFHVLCGTPSFIVLSGWSELGPAATPVLKLSHAVDTASGDVYDLLGPTGSPYMKTGNAPALVWPGFPEANTFYEVGIDWQPTRVRFFIVRAGVEVTLWTITDVAYVPQVPLPMRFNLWHPPTHLVPARTPADYPAADGVLRVDWAEWRSP